MKIYVIQSKSGIMMNVSVSEKNQINGVPVKKATYGILAHVMVSMIKYVKLVSIQILKVKHAKKHFFSKLILVFQDETLNTRDCINC